VVHVPRVVWLYPGHSCRSSLCEGAWGIGTGSRTVPPATAQEEIRMFVQRGLDRRLIQARLDRRIRQRRMIQYLRNHRDVFPGDREPRGTGPSEIVNRHIV
jgi:hypothetical protein